MLGIAVYHFHLTPDAFWKMTAQEFWAVMRTANPELDDTLNNNKKELFTEDEKKQLEEMLRKYG